MTPREIKARVAVLNRTGIKGGHTQIKAMAFAARSVEEVEVLWEAIRDEHRQGWDVRPLLLAMPMMVDDPRSVVHERQRLQTHIFTQCPSPTYRFLRLRRCPCCFKRMMVTAKVPARFVCVEASGICRYHVDDRIQQTVLACESGCRPSEILNEFGIKEFLNRYEVKQDESLCDHGQSRVMNIYHKSRLCEIRTAREVPCPN